MLRVLPVNQAYPLEHGGQVVVCSVELWSHAVRIVQAGVGADLAAAHRDQVDRPWSPDVLSDDVGTAYGIGTGGGGGGPDFLAFSSIFEVPAPANATVLFWTPSTSLFVTDEPILISLVDAK